MLAIARGAAAASPWVGQKASLLLAAGLDGPWESCRFASSDSKKAQASHATGHENPSPKRCKTASARSQQSLHQSLRQSEAKTNILIEDDPKAGSDGKGLDKAVSSLKQEKKEDSNTTQREGLFDIRRETKPEWQERMSRIRLAEYHRYLAAEAAYQSFLIDWKAKMNRGYESIKRQGSTTKDPSIGVSETERKLKVGLLEVVQQMEQQIEKSAELLEKIKSQVHYTVPSNSGNLSVEEVLGSSKFIESAVRNDESTIAATGHMQEPEKIAGDKLTIPVLSAVSETLPASPFLSDGSPTVKAKGNTTGAEAKAKQLAIAADADDAKAKTENESEAGSKPLEASKVKRRESAATIASETSEKVQIQEEDTSAINPSEDTGAVSSPVEQGSVAELLKDASSTLSPPVHDSEAIDLLPIAATISRSRSGLFENLLTEAERAQLTKIEQGWTPQEASGYIRATSKDANVALHNVTNVGPGNADLDPSDKDGFLGKMDGENDRAFELNEGQYIAIDIDADQLFFLPELLREGKKGATKALNLIRAYASEYLSLRGILPLKQLHIRCYCNLGGLLAFCAYSSNICTPRKFYEFVAGFNRINESIKLIDAGNTSQAADERMFASFREHLEDANCVMAFIGGVADFGYNTKLRRLHVQGKLEKARIIHAPRTRAYDEFDDFKVFWGEEIFTTQIRLLDDGKLSVVNDRIAAEAFKEGKKPYFYTYDENGTSIPSTEERRLFFLSGEWTIEEKQRYVGRTDRIAPVPS